MNRFFTLFAVACAVCVGIAGARAQDGITPSAILIGQSAAFTGPAAHISDRTSYSGTGVLRYLVLFGRCHAVEWRFTV